MKITTKDYTIELTMEEYKEMFPDEPNIKPILSHKDFVKNVQDGLNIKHNNHKRGRPKRDVV